MHRRPAAAGTKDVGGGDVASTSAPGGNEMVVEQEGDFKEHLYKVNTTLLVTTALVRYFGLYDFVSGHGHSRRRCHREVWPFGQVTKCLAWINELEQWY